MKKPEQYYSLADSEICTACRDDLRFLYPLDYLTRSTKLRELPQCEGLTRKELTALRKNLRVIPAHDGDRPTKLYCMDRMQLLTLEKFRALLPTADALEDRIRSRYLDYTNVLPVEYARALCRPIGKKGIQNVRKRKTGYCVTGYIRAGAFREGDMVGIAHNGSIRYADLLALDYEEKTVSKDGAELRTGCAESMGDAGNRGICIRAGYQVTMVLSEKAAGIEAGDWIVTD